MSMIQQDPELWDLIEKIKDEDASLEFFLDDLAEMFAIEFRVMDTSDLDDKLDQLFGGLPRKAMVLVLVTYFFREIYKRQSREIKKKCKEVMQSAPLILPGY